MKERPILFSGEMVRAILDGHKKQTRRLIKPQPDAPVTDAIPRRDFPHGPPTIDWYWRPRFGHRQNAPSAGWDFKCPYGQPGDRLIVAKEIPGISRNYCAGSNGVIYSRARGEWRPLKAHGNSNSYPCVTIMDGKRKTTRSVHSLVCSAFYGLAPFPGAQVRHLDGDSSNSLPVNLAWGSQQENWQDRQAHGNGIHGGKHHAAKLTDAEREALRWSIQKGLCSQRHAARVLGMAQSAISQIAAGCDAVEVSQDIPGERIPSITLEIVSVRVERLNAISNEDALAEGVGVPRDVLHSPQDGFKSLWESINGAGSWDENPWVWVVEFKRVK